MVSMMTSASSPCSNAWISPIAHAAAQMVTASAALADGDNDASSCLGTTNVTSSNNPASANDCCTASAFSVTAYTHLSFLVLDCCCCCCFWASPSASAWAIGCRLWMTMLRCPSSSASETAASSWLVTAMTPPSHSQSWMLTPSWISFLSSQMPLGCCRCWTPRLLLFLLLACTWRASRTGTWTGSGGCRCHRSPCWRLRARLLVLMRMTEIRPKPNPVAQQHPDSTSCVSSLAGFAPSWPSA
mmetsp:Transcript_26964/g.75825  ORF Transcript_26964/g.75825 Transcript_26964/m.75825 type:complete len:243 (-) Transcript_26964:206-934(-)